MRSAGPLLDVTSHNKDYYNWLSFVLIVCMRRLYKIMHIIPLKRMSNSFLKVFMFLA